MANKGSPFEREICKKLSVWWTGDPDCDVVFWRTSQSGGRVTYRKRKGKKKVAAAHCGDITAIDKDAEPFTKLITPELKRGYNKAGPHQLLTRNPKKPGKPLFEQFIKQAQTAAKYAKTEFWALIHKPDQGATVIYIPWVLKECLREICGCDWDLPIMDLHCERISGCRQHRIVGITLDAFLSGTSPGDIRAVLRHLT